jgi:hypothetical protein
MTSPAQPEATASETTSPRPTLLPSPFTHTDEQIETSPSFRGGGGERQLPRPVQATSASIYEEGLRRDDGGGEEEGGHGEVEEEVRDGEGDEEARVDEEDGEDDDYPPQDDAESLLPPQNFHPFFTLITDAITGEAYHPSTYYVFSDDEPDVLTTASLHALDSYMPQSPNPQANTNAPAGTEAQDQERYIIVDLSPTGTQIQQAKSLSPEWAITGAQVRGAPTFETAEDDGARGGGGEGLMLILEGMGMQGTSSASTLRNPEPGETDEAARGKKSRDLLEEARKRGGGSLVQGMEELRVGLCGGLGVLDKIVGGLDSE